MFLPIQFLIIIGVFTLSAEIPLSTMPPMTEIFHPVSTTNAEAQKKFDLGLTNIYGFNHSLAYKEFEKASQLDPELAMAYWGMALALGQNINEEITPENEIKAYEIIQKALRLSKNASENEQAYIAALAKRYSSIPNANINSLNFLYRDAMKNVTDRYPEDLDAATLYAESNLNLFSWRWWTPDGKPREGTLEAIAALESVLRRNPDHFGANHYYIHALEESPYPERALNSANRLYNIDLSQGHLLHMPSHIFILVGDYEKAMIANKKAIAAEQNYYDKLGFLGFQSPHYLFFLTRIYTLMENYGSAIKSAFELTDELQTFYDKSIDFSRFYIVPLEVYLYFHKWNDILQFNPSSQSPLFQAYWHFSRAVAYASLSDIDSAVRERVLMNEIIQKIPTDKEFANNSVVILFKIADLMVEASLLLAQKKHAEYIEILKKAIEIQDQLNYSEPPAWYMPIRQKLGSAYLIQGNNIEAERAFRRILQHLQRNGRSLFGLSLSLKGQGRISEAYGVEREMKAALQHSSQPLQITEL